MLKSTTPLLLRLIFIVAFSLAFITSSFSQTSTPSSESTKPNLNATRISTPPVIDGVLDDNCWLQATPTDEFTMFDPDHGTSPRFRTELRIVYDNEAIYVSAMMHDSQPDSIKRQLGLRDDQNLNADYFIIGFDTYNNQQDAYYFAVSASGLQLDQREVDETFNTVWSSAVEINKQGWVAEMRIPYSALRFPAVPQQLWSMQVIRTIRRSREEYHWALQEKGNQNQLNYWGTLSGLSNIDPPLRLSAVPYLSTSLQHNSSPEYKSDAYSFRYNGGMDVKWGLNESFTLDMILMPDFSQVKSDMIEKNLSAYEQVYDENRPFFNEGTDLFQKGELFYSRRIGRTPLMANSVNDSLHSGEKVVSNPFNARLINAVKVSGRNSNGLGIGFFNALTGNTWAIVKDSIGNERRILTDPVTNYNILVFDQNLKNNSSMYIINTNVIRPAGWKQSNVTAAGLKLGEKSNTYQLMIDGALSTTKSPLLNGQTVEDKVGQHYSIQFAKMKGNFNFRVDQEIMDKHYNKNDMGVTQTNDWSETEAVVAYNFYDPFWILRNMYNAFIFRRVGSLSTGQNIMTFYAYELNTTFKNYLSAGTTIVIGPHDRVDFYEARTPGAIFKKPGFNEYNFYFSSDYRKTLAIDGRMSISKNYDESSWQFFMVQPIIRFNDHFKVSPEMFFQFGDNDKGFVSSNASSIIFGRRDIHTVTTSISAEYIFTNKISLNLWARQYWQTGAYNKFYTLAGDGSLLDNNEYSGNHNYNYNTFNIDLVFGWEFSPGSMINVVWKNALQREDDLYKLRYFDNFTRMMKSPQINNLSLKVLYYLDYQMIRKKKV